MWRDWLSRGCEYFFVRFRCLKLKESFPGASSGIRDLKRTYAISILFVAFKRFLFFCLYQLLSHVRSLAGVPDNSRPGESFLARRRVPTLTNLSDETERKSLTFQIFILQFSLKANLSQKAYFDLAVEQSASRIAKCQFNDDKVETKSEVHHRWDQELGTVIFAVKVVTRL